MSLSRIAQALGLSVTTVSRALGGFDDVSRATRSRVETEAARIGYRPNRAARMLRGGRSGAVAMVLPAAPGQFDDPFFLRMLMAVGGSLERAGLDLMVTGARGGADEAAAFARLIAERRVDGVLIARTRCRDARIAALLDGGMPFVTHGRSLECRPHAYVDIDGAAAARSATERLIAFGHTRIGLVNADPAYMFARHRRAGWAMALRAAGLPPGPMLAAEPTPENGFLLARQMLELAEPPTALLCTTDRLAVGALHAVAALGLRAGHDVSVIGYDDLPLATYTTPALTTFAQPIEEAAERMVAMLVRLMAGDDPAGLREILQARLVARDSDGPVARQSMRETAHAKASKETTGDYRDVQDPPA